MSENNNNELSNIIIETLNHYDKVLEESNLPKMTDEEKKGWVDLFLTDGYLEITTNDKIAVKMGMEQSIEENGSKLGNLSSKLSNIAKDKLSKEQKLDSRKILFEAPNTMLYWRNAGNHAILAAPMVTKMMFKGNEEYNPMNAVTDSNYIPESFWVKWEQTTTYSKMVRKLKKQAKKVCNLKTGKGMSKMSGKLGSAMPFRGR